MPGETKQITIDSRELALILSGLRMLGIFLAIGAEMSRSKWLRWSTR